MGNLDSLVASLEPDSNSVLQIEESQLENSEESQSDLESQDGMSSGLFGGIGVSFLLLFLILGHPKCNN